MRPRDLPPLSPLGTRRGAGRALPAALVELLRGSDLDETGAFLAWQLALLPRGLGDGERAALALLVGRLLAAEAQGSTRIAVGDQEHRLLGRAGELAGDPSAGRRTPLVLDGGWLYTERSHACETRVASRLRARLVPGPFSPADIERAVADAATVTVPSPSDEQRAAVAAALGRRLGVIAGGPGTGKTTAALLLLRSLARLGVAPAAIALAAPTGKAASRLEEDVRTRLAALPHLPALDRELGALAPAAQTLHRLLGATAEPGGFARSARAPLPVRAVIVDESSMIDLVLMDRLLDALPERSQLVLLGDADQLPSVSAGAVFRDLGSCAVSLSRPFRADPSRAAGSRLAALAQAVRAGKVEESAGLCATRAGLDGLARVGGEHLPSELRGELLRAHHDRLLPVAGLARGAFVLRDGCFATDDLPRLEAMAAHLGSTRVLCVTRQGSAGSEQSNAFLHRLAGGGADFLPGEPVLVLRNDHERELANGDQGVVVRVHEPGQAPIPAAAFRSRRGWQAVPLPALASAVALGYALTVHKAQGSEYDEVLLLLPDLPCPLLTRELLYTAVSRARQSVLVCGDLAAWKAGVATAEARGSGLAERLGGQLALAEHRR
jgi:exodeoxyribonuclease V alpha subunit